MVLSLAQTLRHSEKPLLAAINGTAVSGGLEMTLHYDQRFAVTDARLGWQRININFIPPIGATQAIRLLYDSSLITAQGAYEIGPVDTLGRA